MSVVLKRIFQRCAVPCPFPAVRTLAGARYHGDLAQEFERARRSEEGVREVTFGDSEWATRGKTTWEVFRGWLVFKLFSYDILVDNSLKVNYL